MTDFGNNAILKVSTSGQFLASYAIPTANAEPNGITAGPDGNVWFTEYRGEHIGRITPSGTIAEFAIPTGSANPQVIVAGPDGRMWFTELSSEAGQGKIGYITVDGKQVRDFFNDGFHVHDLAFDAHGTLWDLALKDLSPFSPEYVETFAY
jgi:virginiamycin B lyase